MSVEAQDKKRKAESGASESVDTESTKKLREELAQTKKQLADTIKELSEAKALIESLQGGAQNEDDDVSDDEEGSGGTDTWDTKFIMLRAFRIQEGHCRVPCGNPNIGQWVSNQGRAYKNVKTGK